MWQFSSFFQRSASRFGRLLPTGFTLGHYRLSFLLIILTTAAMGQSRALFDVTPQQIPNLPKLTDGAQAWTNHNGKGQQDLIITGSSGSGYLTRFYRITAEGFSDATTVIPNVVGVINSTVTWGDYNGDGWDDLFMTGWTGNQAISRLYRYNGNWFEDMTSLLPGLPGLSHGAVLWTDVDRDGKLDLLVSGFTSNSSNDGAFSQLYLNKGNTVFVKASNFPNLPQVGNSALSSADFNKDGRPDLLITGNTGSERISKLYFSTSAPGEYRNVTNGVPDLPGINRSALAVGDYDKDGLPDLMLTGSSGVGPVSKLYHNKVIWNNFEEVPTGILNVKSSALDWGDYDNDGRPDLAITGQRYYTDAKGTTKLIPLGAIYHNTVNGFDEVTLEKTYGNLPDVFNGMVAWGRPNPDDEHLYLTVAGDQGHGVKSYVRSFFQNNSTQEFPHLQWPEARFMSKGENVTLIVILAAAVLPLDYFHIGELLVDIITEVLHEITLDDPGVLAPPFPGPLAYGSAQFIDDPVLGRGSLFLTGYFYQDDAVEQFQSAPAIQLITGGGAPSPAQKKMIQSLPLVGLSASDWADFNHDGLLDVAIIGRQGIGNYQSPYKGTAGVYLQPNGQLIPLPGNPGLRNGTVDWVDYDNDGWADLLVTGRDLGTDNDQNNDYHYYTFLYHNEQGQGFTDASNLLPNVPRVAYSAAAWGDYDNDGRPDLMLTGESKDNPVSVLYHNTGAGFENVSSLLPNLPGLNTGTVHWVDYDHDGLLDLMVTGDSYGGPVTKLYRNKGLNVLFENASAQLPNLPGLANGTADWVDYDKDGRLDLILTGDNGAGFDTRVYHNTPTGFVDVSGQMSNLPRVALSATAFGDYDGDGFPDLLLTGKTEYGGPVGGLYHNMPLDVSSLLPDLPSLANSSVAWGDYDSDGKLDLLLTGTTDLTHGISRLYHNNGTGFEDRSGLIPGLPQLGFGSVAWGDYDNDGRLDLIMTGSPNAFSGVSKLYHNTGSGFEDKSTLIPDLPQLRFSAVAWADNNNDGKLDLLITGQSGETRISRFYANLNGEFVDITNNLPGLPQVSEGAVAWGDYDADGWMDLLLTGSVGASSVSKLYHNVGGGFVDASAQLPGLPGVSLSSAAWGDYDHDGKLDLVIMGSSGVSPISKLYHNTGSGFEDQSDRLPNLPGFESGTASWADVNNDGRLDLLLTGISSSGSGSKLYLNTESGFTDGSGLLADILAGNNNAVLADYDKDGRLDLLLTSSAEGGYRSRLYHNLLAPANTVPTAPSGLSSTPIEEPSRVQLNWHRATDAQTPPAGLTYNLYVSDSPGGQNVAGPMADQASGYRRVVRLGNSQALNVTLTNLTPGKTYYWSVQAIDGVFVGSAFAPEQSFTLSELEEVESTRFRLVAPEYNCRSGAFTFRTKGGDGSPIQYMAPGITAWTTNPHQFVDRELRTAADAQPITLVAHQNGKEVYLTWDIRLVCPVGDPKKLQLVAPLYNCQTGAFTFQTTGGDGSPIEYMAAGITAWTTNPYQFVDQGLRQAADAKPLLLKVRQKGQEDTYKWDLRALCPVGVGRCTCPCCVASPSARLGVGGEPGVGLKAMVYPNPVVSEEVTVVLEGAQGESVKLLVVDQQGRAVVERQVAVEQPRQEERLRLGSAPGGLYLLRVSTARESQTLKLIKTP